MRYEFTETAPDFSGTITVTAETSPEVLELADHFRMFDKTKPADLMDLARAMQAGTLTYASNPQSKRRWFRVEAALDHEYTKPYTDLLRRVTGADLDHFPDMDLTPFHPRRLCHTHITAACTMEHGHYCYDVLIQAEDWNGKDAFTRAQINAQDYAEEDLGHRPFEREYVEGRNGVLMRNPNYLKRHRAKPTTGAPWLWAALFNWWRATHATPGQAAALALCDATHAKHRLEPDYLIRSSGGPAGLIGYGGIITSFNEPVARVSWEEFAKL
ncbi:MAG TPA: hypothetical protein VM529_24840 [Gemmata sp.]|jgi:hypothetical protein|nr:hypothetical protein [Gemmata sp.]